MKSLCLLAVCFLPLTLAGLQASLGLGSQQSVAVTGDLTCFGKPVVGARIKLYDRDINSPDDLMAEGVSDSLGHFHISGSETEMSNIDPKLNVYHTCNHRGPCVQKMKVYIPEDYISEGATAHRIFDVGTLKLEFQYVGQSTDCIN